MTAYFELSISYDFVQLAHLTGAGSLSVKDIVRFDGRYSTILRQMSQAISYQQISYDFTKDIVQFTAVVQLDIVHMPHQYSTDIVPILRNPHLNYCPPVLTTAPVARCCTCRHRAPIATAPVATAPIATWPATAQRPTPAV